MLRSLIIGAGLMGRHHASASVRAGAAVVAVVDPDLAAARRLSTRLGHCAAENSVTDALARHRVDVVHICTPLETHAAVAEEVAGRNVNALIEKPLASSSEATERVLSLFSDAGKLVCPVHQYAFQRGFEDALRKLAAIGPMRRIDFDIRSAGGGDDRSRLDECVANILPHPLSMVQRLLARLEVDTLAWQMLRPAPGDWLCTSSRGEVILSIGISLASRPTCFKCRVIGERGTIEIDGFHGYSVAYRGRHSRFYKLAQPYHVGGLHLAAATSNLIGRAVRREPAYPGLEQLVRLFYAAIERNDGQAVPVSPAQSLAIARVRDEMLALAGRDR